MNIHRAFRHLFHHPWTVSRCFPSKTMAAIERAIKAAEQSHAGQIVVAVEPALDLSGILRGLSPRARALEVFSLQRVWDTEQNCGVLIYLLLADRSVEIVADRGAHLHAGQEAWDKICREMEHCFEQANFEGGVLLGIERVSELLKARFPKTNANRNELSDRSVIL